MTERHKDGGFNVSCGSTVYWHLTSGERSCWEHFKGGEGGASGDHIRLVSASLMHSSQWHVYSPRQPPAEAPLHNVEHFEVSVRKPKGIIAGHVSVRIRSFSEWRYSHCKTCKLSLTLLYRHDDPHTLTLSPCSIPPFQLFTAHPLKQSECQIFIDFYLSRGKSAEHIFDFSPPLITHMAGVGGVYVPCSRLESCWPQSCVVIVDTVNTCSGDRRVF